MSLADKGYVKHKAFGKQFDLYFMTFRLKTGIYAHDNAMRTDLEVSNLVINKE